MKQKDFQSKYALLKSLIEEIDPAGFGAAGEYDDALFKILAVNENVFKAEVYAANAARIVADELGVDEEQIRQDMQILSQRVLDDA